MSVVSVLITDDEPHYFYIGIARADAARRGCIAFVWNQRLYPTIQDTTLTWDELPPVAKILKPLTTPIGHAESQMNDPESFQEQLSRVKQMAQDDGESWDLSENDRAALTALLNAYAEAMKPRGSVTAYDQLLSDLPDPNNRKMGEKRTA